ncbi:MAG: DUF2318 domain-containing protein [Oscillospiraceae bacterium]|nr:DUF2318 domain-containing protein [Oscillospiraceae bacterium]
MLKYFIDTTAALLTAALLTGLAVFYAERVCGKTGKRITTGCALLGLVISGVMAYFKNATKLYDTSRWNLRIFTAAVVVFIVFLVYSLVKGKARGIVSAAVLTLLTGGLFVYFRFVNTTFGDTFFIAAKNPGVKTALMIGVPVVSIAAFAAALILEKRRKTQDIAAPLLAGILAVIAMGYALPDVLSYPYNILLVEKSALSTVFLFKMIGVILGFLLAYLAGLAAGKGLLRLQKGEAFAIVTAAFGIHALRQIAGCLKVMQTKRLVESNHTMFEIVKFTSNHDNWFLFGIMIVTAVIPLLIYLKSARVNEPYNTPAEHRKIRKKWIVNRRWATTAVLCLVMVVVNFTILSPIANAEVQLSPVEETRVEDGNVIVPFEMVEDGHLHRFGYTTEGGVQIRFIVIKKPNSSSYGIGLDACDICGETGYYEKDGQVVCKLCDVVMNINTIGFKGGCNPIVIPYTIENGSILVPVEGLAAYEKEFKN